MIPRTLSTLVVLSLLIVTGCSSKALDQKVAADVLGRNPLLDGITPVAVEAISQDSSQPEAIARVLIDGATYNFKFRRYDDGWRWEFAETKAGGWVAPDIVTEQIREQRRLKKAGEWATANREMYQKTIAAMAGYARNQPRRPGTPLGIEAWQQGRDFWKSATKPTSRSDAEQEAILYKYLGNSHDAWGNEILLHFDNAKRVATFVSIGADKTKGTPDDVACMSEGRREWDDFYDGLMFNYFNTWQVPEGLEDLAKPFAGDKDGGSATVLAARVVEK